MNGSRINPRSVAEAAKGLADNASTNIHAVIALERASQRERTPLERFIDRVSAAASSTTFIVLHVVWFGLWLGTNVWSRFRFDPFPFSLLTLVVSLEAILLTGFVLISQDHMARLADRRAHLDLQINLLAEQELTAILKVVCLIADKTGVDLTTCDPNLDQLLGRTDVKAINDELNREMQIEQQTPDVRGDASTPATA